MLKGAFIHRSGSPADNGHMSSVRMPSPVTRPARQGWRARTVTVLAGLLLGFALPAAQAGERGDHERARAAVQAGEVLPLSTVLERLQRTHPGQVLGLELDQEDGRWIYEIKLLQADGQLLKLDIDARTAEVLTIQRRRGPIPPDRRDHEPTR